MINKKLVFKKSGPKTQANATSKTYNQSVSMTYGTIKATGTNGTCTVTLVNGFDVEDISLPSTTAPTKDTVTGGLEYPPIGAEVIILHPEGDIGSGFIMNAPLDVRDEGVETALFNQGDIKLIQGGWGRTYNIETGQVIWNHGVFTMTIDPDTGEVIMKDFQGNSWIFDSLGVSIKDFNGNEINQTATGIQLKTGDASIWMPNILPNCLFTGAPHGGPTAGIVKLTGA